MWMDFYQLIFKRTTKEFTHYRKNTYLHDLRKEISEANFTLLGRVNSQQSKCAVSYHFPRNYTHKA